MYLPKNTRLKDVNCKHYPVVLGHTAEEPEKERELCVCVSGGAVLM